MKGNNLARRLSQRLSVVHLGLGAQAVDFSATLSQQRPMYLGSVRQGSVRQRLVDRLDKHSDDAFSNTVSIRNSGLVVGIAPSD